ncbi:MFS transporter [Pseudoalteromonas rubra]|uniref:MFS transporter n=1 Tax=Pseudoalteromonas rubra TaxID=43658 RepID=A0A5S3WYC4_9GAMM|nr:MFS transporter [Pseudoalteromonas rubra]TMP34744.1 hypothetical protein CWB98_17255 [Pseudoalteromonas rubra]
MYHHIKDLSSNERKILTSQSISTIGDFMALPALLIIAYERGEQFVSLLLIIYFLPRFFQPIFGIIADKYDLKKIILSSELLRGLIFIVLFLYPSDYPIYLWLAIAGINSMLGSIFDPARLKLMTEVSDDFPSFNSIFNFFYSAGGLLSIAISIWCEANYETEVIFLLNAATFFISFIVLAPMKIELIEPSYVKFDIKSIATGLKYFRPGSRLSVLLILMIFIDFYTGVFYEKFPSKSIEIGFSEYGPYIFSALICLGNSMGAVLINTASKKPALSYSFMTALIVSVFIFFSQSNWFLSFFFCTVFFIGQMIFIGVSEVFIEQDVPHSSRGRVFAINESLPIAALMIGSWCSNIFSSNQLFIATISMLVISLSMMMWRKHQQEQKPV